jgi:hypothetical protein
MNFLSIGEAAKELDVPPYTLSKTLYNLGREGDRLAPVIGRRRLVLRGSMGQLREVFAARAAKKRETVG